ncbi:MAG: outer membrane beta-barrel protein [Bacteroidota bacterium]
MFKKITGTFLVAGMAFTAMAQDTDSTKALTISGSLDAYYRYNPAKGSGYTGDGSYNSFTSFTRANNAFELGMASLRADATAFSGKVGATVDLGYGHRAEEFSYNDYGNNTLQFIKQAYITYAPSSAVKFTIGKFGTHVGYELLDAPLNRNYSMSYMFTNGPFFHTGAKADFTLGKLGLMIGVAGPVDRTTTSSGVKSLLAQVSSTTSDKIKLYLNYWGYFGNESESTDVSFDGAQSVNQLDLVATGIITDKFNIGFNGTLQSRKKVYEVGKSAEGKTWYGAAVYLNVDPTPNLGITLRNEFISDKDAFFYGTKNIFESTLSLNAKVGPLTFIPELRIDSAKDGLFIKNDGNSSKSTFSALLAAVYKF